jgi:hypothetical protein
MNFVFLLNLVLYIFSHYIGSDVVGTVCEMNSSSVTGTKCVESERSVVLCRGENRINIVPKRISAARSRINLQLHGRG